MCKYTATHPRRKTMDGSAETLITYQLQDDIALIAHP
jgi:hypothetical protein